MNEVKWKYHNFGFQTKSALFSKKFCFVVINLCLLYYIYSDILNYYKERSIITEFPLKYDTWDYQQSADGLSVQSNSYACICELQF